MAGFSVLISGVACSSVAFCSSAVWLCWADAGTAGIEGFGTPTRPLGASSPLLRIQSLAAWRNSLPFGGNKCMRAPSMEDLMREDSPAAWTATQSGYSRDGASLNAFWTTSRDTRPGTSR